VGDGDAAARLEEVEVGRIFREEPGRSLAALIGVFGRHRSGRGRGPGGLRGRRGQVAGRWRAANPGGWITTTTARHHAIDRRRREARGRELLGEVALLAPGGDDPGRPQQVGPVPDDRLRLIFTCCRPVLAVVDLVDNAGLSGPADPGLCVASSRTCEWYQVRDGKIASVSVVFDARPFAPLFEAQHGG
jgi:hypothetical protein